MRIIYLLLVFCFTSCFPQKKVSKEEYLNIIVTNTVNTFENFSLNNLLAKEDTADSFRKIDNTIVSSLKNIQELNTLENDFGLRSGSIQLLESYKKFIEKNKLFIQELENVTKKQEITTSVDSINDEIHSLKKPFDKMEKNLNEVFELMEKTESFNKKVLEFRKFYNIEIPNDTQN